MVPPILTGALGMLMFVLLAVAVTKYGWLSMTGLSKRTQFIAILVLGLVISGVGASLWAGSGVNTASLSGTTTAQSEELYGDVTVRLAAGVVNTSANDDYLNSAEDVITFYIADADIIDGEKIQFNATIERTKVSKGAAFIVECTAPDKDISGITADNLVEKTAGDIDLTVDGSGTHTSTNTVRKVVSLAEGTSSTTIRIAYDQEESYEDGMTPYDDVAEVNCLVRDDASSFSVPFRAEHIAID